MTESTDKPRAILFDYGGVLAEEGFRDGLSEWARRHGKDPRDVLEKAMDAVYESGYVLGTGSETQFWQLLQKKTGIRGDRHRVKQDILQRFRLRPWMLNLVDTLREKGYRVGILSDQTDWLEKLDERDHFFKHFDLVLNSYHLGMGKRNPEVFLKAADSLHLPPQQVLFVDDSPGNVQRARQAGLQGILFRNRGQFEEALQERLSV
ncbi:HAD family hydrolase [Thiolapillus brandeum]|uniref:HAD-superfamily hydrolase n=1 Tax=Thiolapillus brandeum TaxID=1076588 RepID=A0A7U6JHV6_9GAMM|nr:HAD family phosphatase [Thiolapillus brandeum]BAO43600.1 HAD-superfamily hydrolase [Thiolapillus brandeum]